MQTVAFDTETHAITPGNLTPRLVCVSFAVQDDVFLLDRQDGLELIEEGLRQGYTYVGHNVAYDFGVLANENPKLFPLIFQAYAENRIHDTKVREELRDIALGRVTLGTHPMVSINGKWTPCDYSLAGLVLRYLGKSRHDEKSAATAWRFRYAELDGTPLYKWPVEARNYALEDAKDTLAVFRAQEAVHDEFTQVRAAWALHLMSVHGMVTDKKAVEELETSLLSEQEKNRRRLIQAKFLKGVKLTPKEIREGKAEDFIHGNAKMRWAKDTKRIKEYVERVYRRQGKTPPLTESGAVSTDKDTLNQSGSRLLALLSDAGGVDKLLQTYIPVLQQGVEKPINARFNVLVSSGRTSCFVGETLIRTPEGYVKLASIRVGMLVWTHQNRWRKVTAFFEQGIQEVVEVTLSNGEQFACTRDHLFLTKANRWLALEEIGYEFFKKLDTQQSKPTSSRDSVSKQRLEDNRDYRKNVEYDTTQYNRRFTFGDVTRRIQSIKTSALSLIQNRREKSNVAEKLGATSQLERGLRRWLWLFDASRQGRYTTFRASNRDGRSSWLAVFARNFIRSSHRRKSEKQHFGQFGFNNTTRAFDNSLNAKTRQFFVTIKEIKTGGSREVFDISVEEDESFEVAGVFAHNCSSPNLQNLPTGRRVSGVRECFVPRETMQVVEVPDNYVLQPGEEWADE